MAFCDCLPDLLCASCYGRELHTKRLQAAALGQCWAERICRGEHRARDAWPVIDERMLAIARRKVESLALDPRLRDELAVACSRGAATWWARRPARYR